MGKASRRKRLARLERLANEDYEKYGQAWTDALHENFFSDDDDDDEVILGWSFGGMIDGEYVEYSEDFI